MAGVWSEERKLERWLDVELAALDGWAELGVIPEDVARSAQRAGGCAHAERVRELEEKTGHDLAAFVDAVGEGLDDEGRRWLHYGLTSSDVLDTALALQVREAGALLLEGLDRAFAAVVARAEEHRQTLIIGRTHGIHAEPTTFGLKLAGWAFELDRGRARLERALEGMRVGKLSGAVGTYAATGPGAGAARVRASRSRAGASLHADHPARPARGAPRGARRHRVVARRVRARDPPPRADGGPRGRGAVRRRPEGLLGDAAQAQPDHRRAHLRPRARRTRRRAGRARERRPLARARHLALVRRARRHPRRVPRGRLHARPLRVARRRPRRSRRPHAREPRREPRPLLQPAAAAGARRVGPGARRRVSPRAAPRDGAWDDGPRLP